MLTCPITLDPLVEPMVLVCGHMLEKSAWAMAVAAGNKVCPCCRAPMRPAPQHLQDLLLHHVELVACGSASPSERTLIRLYYALLREDAPSALEAWKLCCEQMSGSDDAVWRAVTSTGEHRQEPLLTLSLRLPDAVVLRDMLVFAPVGPPPAAVEDLLELAIMQRHMPALEALANCAAFTTFTPARPDGKTPLHRAVETWNYAAIRLLRTLEERMGASWSTTRSRTGETPLDAAIVRHDPRMIALLRPPQELFKAKKATIRGPLELAFHCDVLRVIQAVLQALPDTAFVPFTTGSMPLYHATQCRREDLMLAILSNPQEGVANANPFGPSAASSPLHLCACRGDHRLMAILLKREDIAINRPDAEDRTPLQIAALFNHTKVVLQLLADKRTRPRQRTFEHPRAFGCALRSGHWSLAVRLMLGSRRRA